MMFLQDPISSLPAAAQWSIAGAFLAALIFAVNTIRQISEKGADRAEKAQANCDQHNKATVEQFSNTVCKMDEGHRELVTEMRQASERREERLHELVRELRGLPRTRSQDPT